MSDLRDALNFFHWPPRIQGFTVGVALMALAAIADTLLGHCR